MRPSSRVALALSATAVLALFTGCGSTLYDAVGVPQLACTAERPLACVEACLPLAQEDANHCGTSCAACEAPNHASARCDNTAVDASQHACTFDCDATFVPDGAGGCACPLGTNACGAETSCSPEDVNRCGAGCQPCQVPANGGAGCNQGSCTFTCNTGFRPDPNGFGCVCDVGNTQCPGTAACVTQDLTHCGPNCDTCTAPPHATPRCNGGVGACEFDCDATLHYVKAGNVCVCDAATGFHSCSGSCVVESPASCGPGCATCSAPAGATALCSNHACDYICPADKPNKCTNPTTGAPDCCAVVIPCTADQVACGTAGACVTEDALNCGNGTTSTTTCIQCPPPPPGATEVCNASTGHRCDFVCPAGTFKTSAGCERVGSGAADVALGANHTCVITETSRTVKCWGANDSGQLGDGTSGTDRSAAVTVAGLPAGALPVALAAGGAHTCAVLGGAAAGQVWCWGANGSGQLGDTPGTAPVLTPGRAGTIVASTAVAVPIAAGARHTCIVNAAGGVACWGANDVGQLGNGTRNASAAAVAVSGLASGVSAIATGSDTTCALVGGAVRCWGADDAGQTGSGKNSALGQIVPQAAIVTSGASAIAVGRSHACAVVTAGGATVPECWGNNVELEFGASKFDLPQSPTPVVADKISANTGTTLVSAGAVHTCVAKPLDTVPACAGAEGTGAPPAVGTNGTNKVDVGSVADGLVPLTVTRIFSGGRHNCELVQPAAGGAASLWCWGVNDRGQFGNGALSGPTTSPAQPLPR